MIPLLILGGAAIIAAGAAAKYWSSIRDWILRAAKKVQEMISGIVFGVKVFIKKMTEAYQEISRHYSQDKEGNWEETTVTRKIDPSDVPKDILKLASNNTEKEITEELQLHLAQN